MAAPRKPAGDVAAPYAAVRDLGLANRILANEGIFDAFGHVSMRHPVNRERYLLARQVAPLLVQGEDVLVMDLDSVPVGETSVALFIERFIHGEIYKRRPDVQAIVHSHSPTTIPFGVTSVKLRPLSHMSGFLEPTVPVFEIRSEVKNNDMLIRTPALGLALAETLGDRPVALLRGHGNVVVATDVKVAVYRAVYCELNARLQLQALQLDSRPRYLTTVEAENSDTSNMKVVGRAWRYWAERAGCADLLD